MDLLQMLMDAQEGQAVQQLGKSVGLGQDDAASAVKNLLPALAAGLKRNTSQQGGPEGLMGALSGGSHQRYLDEPASLSSEATIKDGNGILGHLLGSKDVSRQVAARASAKTGIGADVLKKMLPLVAAMAMGGLSKQAKSGALGSASQAGKGGLLDMLTPMLDSDKDGSVVDDVMGMLGKTFGR